MGRGKSENVSSPSMGLALGVYHLAVTHGRLLFGNLAGTIRRRGDFFAVFPPASVTVARRVPGTLA